MADLTNKLSSKYSEKNRYNNFGPCIRKVYIDGFRGINKVELTLDFPITAISGLNGAGKSTLGQLAICGYRKPSTATEYKRHYIKDFFPISPADPKPISDDAKVVFHYETDDHKKTQEVTISRVNSAWSGYKRQPERHCYYVGFTVYIPKVERRDLSVYGGRELKFTEKREIDKEVIKKMARIIGHKYDDVTFQGVSHKDKTSEIGIASRLGYSYSENNMGFGEGRILYTVDKLENSPEQSLFILEEPETSLHESAQHEFTKYLIDVCQRRHHQIILSTHSSVILNALPPDARKLITRDANGVEVRNKISACHIRAILSSGHVRNLDICVEDIFAKILLTEAIRTKRKDILKAIAIHDIGDKDAVREAVHVLNKTGKKSIAVRDADVGQDIKNHLLSFPGSRPPEVEVFTHPVVSSAIKEKYGIDINWILERDDISDHHKIAKHVAQEAETEEEVIRSFAIEKYIGEISTEFDDLIFQIQKYL
ncbi:ATP-dependent nuclease [Ectopseudomonas oleovorans]|uniref:ATP-dependent nuclease n=1 Tax=Ectopseudomonas oleovorans TaxID=301 RepID=UPI00244B4401|nr:AAA family ATPase [Pseudomonas oleovorans]MDH2200420.1 AAA family ATPase [Pseudomonas oleovorans]